MAKFDAIILQFVQKVENQLKNNDPVEVRQTFERLKALGYSETNAKYLIAQCVASEMNRAVEHDQRFDKTHYIQLLERLPQSPE
jgi:Holliday junction resolvasome RuvABC DNA-binding subunit